MHMMSASAGCRCSPGVVDTKGHEGHIRNRLIIQNLLSAAVMLPGHNNVRHGRSQQDLVCKMSYLGRLSCI